MSRRRRHTGHSNHERWLVSYADFMTLLFALFVVLYASSQVDKAKMGKLATAIQGAFQQLGVFSGSAAGKPTGIAEALVPKAGNSLDELAGDGSKQNGLAQIDGQTRENFDQRLSSQEVERLKKDLEKALAAEIARRDIALRIGPEGLVVSLREVGFFDSGSPVLKSGAEGTVEHIVKVLRDRGMSVRVEGHTDDVPIHTTQFISNWELSTARATEMIKLLISKYSYAPDRLSAAGYAEFHPVASNATEEGRRQNRRVDLVIFAGPRPTQSALKSLEAPNSKDAVHGSH